MRTFVGCCQNIAEQYGSTEWLLVLDLHKQYNFSRVH